MGVVLVMGYWSYGFFNIHSAIFGAKGYKSCGKNCIDIVLDSPLKHWKYLQVIFEDEGEEVEVNVYYKYDNLYMYNFNKWITDTFLVVNLEGFPLQ